MANPDSGAIPKVLAARQQIDVGATPHTTIPFGYTGELPSSPLATQTEPLFRPAPPNQGPYGPAVQPYHCLTPEASQSDGRQMISQLPRAEAHLEAPFDANNAFELSTFRVPNTPISVSQPSVQGNPDESLVAKPKLPLQKSLGVFSAVIILGGSFLILLAVSFLIFLWAGRGPVEGGIEAPRAWRYIMLHGWATQAVTLTSLGLRVVIAAQAGLCTSMVAALLLERYGVPVSKLVQLSIARSVNVGPMEFLYSSRKIGKMALLKPEALLLFILALTAIGIQFSSTILLSDFGTTRLVRDANQILMNVAISSSTSSQKPGPLSTFGSIDSSMILFGELDSQFDPAPNQIGVSDTGIKRRAFLPFPKEDRIALQHFSGAAFSSVSRVACIKPSMKAILDFSSKGYLLIQGSVNYNKSLEDAGQPPTEKCYTAVGDYEFCLPTKFNCSLPGSHDTQPNPQWTTAVCHLGINVSDVLPGWDRKGSLFDFTSGVWPHLVFTTNIPSSDWQHIKPFVPLTLDNATSYGEWVSNEIEPEKFINTTFCLSTLYGTIASLTMTGNLNQTEPGLLFNTTTGSPEVDSLQTLFGAGGVHKTPAGRGILTITGEVQDPASLSSFDVNKTFAQGAIDYGSIALGVGPAAGVWDNSGGNSVSLCDHCDILGYSVPDDIAALFQNIINTTGRAAVAVDTYLAILSRWWYYYLLPRFDVPGYVDVAFAAEVLLPLRWRGIIAVLVLIGVNTVVMWIIATLYVRRTQFSFAGNYWHAVAQLISKETMPLLEKSREMNDEDLKEQLDIELEDFVVKIGRSTHDGYVTVLKV
ncbi:hypothetical protein RRF57_006272 [Xylaria bambusicola]|uniref:Uncharacterized protein n=1 Tax=Xylaria bambusicola TaxID=326684 RepID=A0AAN7Z5F9_9PEZI